MADPGASSASPRVAARPRCELCASAGTVLHARVPDHDFGVPGHWSLKRCENPACGLVWQDPMLIDEDLGLAYRNYYTHAAGAPKARGQGGSVIDVHFYRYDRWLTRLLGLVGERERFAASYLDDKAPGRVLDVGCGGGAFANVLQRRGWAVRGLDFDPAAAQAAHADYGFPVDVGELGAVAYDSESFDAVTVRHVVEHVREPAAFLGECWRILKPGGHLVIITPNAASLGHRHFGSRWRGLEQPRHLYLYDARSMQALFAKAYIAPVEVFSSPQGASFVMAGSCRAGDGRLRRGFDYAAIWWLYLREGMGTAKGHPVGEELVALAVKPSSPTAARALP